jgi:hypothetical protein
VSGAQGRCVPLAQTFVMLLFSDKSRQYRDKVEAKNSTDLKVQVFEGKVELLRTESREGIYTFGTRAQALVLCQVRLDAIAQS